VTESQVLDLTIFFGDVAGSVELYDAMGDERAHALILSCLNQMTSTIERFGGRVVEVIGDEVMAEFTDTNYALEAACEVQHNLAVTNEHQLGVRIGFHSGQTAVADGHPYGDTVNIAARMVNLAKSGQVLINHQTVEYLSEENQQRLRFMDRMFLKGKKEPYMVHEVLWEESDRTMVVTSKAEGNVNRRRNETSICLSYRDREILVNEASGELVIGRGKQCGLIIHAEAASRIHATVNCRNGKIIIKDQSTNGTFVRTLDGKRSADGLDIFLHHEEWISDAIGVLSLGEAIVEGATDLVHFRFS